MIAKHRKKYIKVFLKNNLHSKAINFPIHRSKIIVGIVVKKNIF